MRQSTQVPRHIIIFHSLCPRVLFVYCAHVCGLYSLTSHTRHTSRQLPPLRPLSSRLFFFPLRHREPPSGPLTAGNSKSGGGRLSQRLSAATRGHAQQRLLGCVCVRSLVRRGQGLRKGKRIFFFFEKKRGQKQERERHFRRAGIVSCGRARAPCPGAPNESSSSPAARRRTRRLSLI